MSNYNYRRLRKYKVWKLHLCGAHVYTRVNKQERLMSSYRTSWNCVRLGSETMTHHVGPLFTEHSFYQTLVVQLWLKSIYVSMFSCQCEILSTVLPHVSVGYYISPLSKNNLCVIVGSGVVPVFLHNICTGSCGCVLAGFHTEPWERGDFPPPQLQFSPPKNHGLES